MRITGGTWRSRMLKVPQDGVRPTSDKVRQAIFNMLNARGAVVDAHVLDAFCGSGALGLEALSQGAESCVFWDKSPQSIRVTKDNASAVGAQAIIKSQNATTIGPRPDTQSKFTLIFLDPPYDQGLVPLAVDALTAGDWVDDEALFVVETATHEDPALPSLTMIQEKIYGDTKVRLFQNAPV